MQLCTNARLLLDMVAASGEPKLWDLTPPEARIKVVELTRMVECKEAIGKIEDRTLPGPDGPIPFRVYTPQAAKDGPSGGVIFFHGGAWVLGNLDTHDCLCRILANESGCRLVSVDYRLAPEHPFPAAVEDACAATAWIAGHGAELPGGCRRLRWRHSGGCCVSKRETFRVKDCTSGTPLPRNRHRSRHSVAPRVRGGILPRRTLNELGWHSLSAVRR
jgi:acetyl esterase